MKLYLIHEELYFGVETRIERFLKASNEKGIECIVLDARRTNQLLVPTLDRNDLLYRLSDGGEALESLMLNRDVTTFFIQNPEWVDNATSTNFAFCHFKAGITQPKTIFDCYTLDRQNLRSYAAHLGFPLIIKAYGGSRGIGVMKIDGWQSFVSCIDYLVIKKERFIIRQLIKTDKVYRLIVLGNEVIASWFSSLMADDFRNASHPTLLELMTEKTPYKLSADIEQLAVKAVRVCNLEFGAVDLVIDENKNPYILEVNFPCGLSYDPSGKNEIVEKIISFLVSKSSLTNGEET